MKYIIANPLSFGSIGNSRSSVGHSFYNWLAALLIADYCNLKFIHAPFQGDSTRYESLIKLGDLYPSLSALKNVTIREHPQLELHNCSTVEEEIKILEKFKQYIETLPDNTGLRFTKGLQFPGKYLISKSDYLIPKLSKNYWKEKELQSEKESYVGVHIRRGDITTENKERWQNLGHYRGIVDKIKNQIPDIKVIIVSEGQTDHFSLFSDCELLLNGSDLKAFQTLAKANILVTGQSTFSTLLAYINKGLIIYTPCLYFTEFTSFPKRFIHYQNLNTYNLSYELNTI